MDRKSPRAKALAQFYESMNQGDLRSMRSPGSTLTKVLRKDPRRAEALACINVGGPDKHESQDSEFCLYNQVMSKSDGDRFPVPKTWQQRVLKAASYAACAQGHPLYRLREKETRISAHGLAFLDSLDGPRLVAVDSSRWTGRIGERIHFHVREHVRVMHVRVMIRESKTSKTLLESGHAYVSLLDPSVWTYVTTTEIRQTPGLCIDVLSNDLAGNYRADIVEFDYE